MCIKLISDPVQVFSPAPMLSGTQTTEPSYFPNFIEILFLALEVFLNHILGL